ncbi:MAG: SMR family transporter [bacterium]|nr:SMR family transporter [bacterium]
MNSEISLKYTFFILIAMAIIFEIAGDVLFKKWSLGNKNTFLYIGLLIYATGTVFWAFSLKYEQLSKAISVFTIVNLIVISLIGILFFKEDISFTNKIGIGLGILSIALIEL